MKVKKDKYVAIFFHSFNGIYSKIGKTRFTLNEKLQFSFRKKAFTLIYSKPIYQYNRTFYYFFDYGNKGQISINPADDDISLLAEFVDDLCNKHVVADILKATKPKMKLMEIVIYLFCGSGLGLFIGYIIRANGWF